MIVTTPEKWDVISRKCRDNEVTDRLTLMIVDEIHLLGDSRGPILESIITRSLNIKNNSGNKVRLIGLSATLPNY